MKPTRTLLLAALASAALIATAQAQAPAEHKPATTAKKTGTGVAVRKGPPAVAGIPRTLYALKYIDTKIGTGPMVTTHHWLTVHYTGYFPDGTKFDSSYDHPDHAPIVFPYGAQRVIIGWDTGFQGMRAGGKRRLFVPYELAYGELGNPPKMPAKQALIFDVELVSFSDKGPTPPTPPTPPASPAAPAAPPIVPKPGDPAVTPPAQTTQPTVDPTKPTVEPKSPVPPTPPKQ
jgi:peptidylprolyl isomerase